MAIIVIKVLKRFITEWLFSMFYRKDSIGGKGREWNIVKNKHENILQKEIVSFIPYF